MKQPPSDFGKRPSDNPESREVFQSALKGDSPPFSWSEPFKALWWDARGNWESAHEIAQELTTPWGSWMHAYLHRKEGDDWNSRYWHRQAGSVFPAGMTLEEERDMLVRELTEKNWDGVARLDQ